MAHLKDERLAQISQRHNVAQFASFSPHGDLRYEVMHMPPARASRVRRRDVLADLLDRASSVNVRTFRDTDSKSTEFVYGIRDLNELIEFVDRFSAKGLYVIVNETIDVHDGGVSGVSMAGVTEFAPDATPRIVEDENSVVARLPTSVAMSVLATVYGFEPDLPSSLGTRVEFSIHPLKVGHRNEHTICWEVADVGRMKLEVRPSWPHRFSELIGDKVFGLLVANAFGLPVPATTVFGRRVAPFRFGTSTNTSEIWLRTSPKVPQAGRFTTHRGWSDPYELLAAEDPKNEIAAVLAQESVDARFSGGAISQPEGMPLVEGVEGFGDGFMLGERRQELSTAILNDVRRLVRRAEGIMGPVQIEWVHDGRQVWVIQIHARNIDLVSPGVINPGHADRWIEFDPRAGLDRLRETVEVAVEEGAGIEVTRAVGVTSHVGDLIRRAGVPGRLAANQSS